MGIDRPGRGQSKLTWFDRQGKPLGMAWAPGAYTELSISPDGSRVAVVRTDNPPGTWIHEFATESSTRLIPRGAAVKPIWSPDSKNLVFAGASNTDAGLYESPGRRSTPAIPDYRLHRNRCGVLAGWALCGVCL